jgi:hypothetical protein
MVSKTLFFIYDLFNDAFRILDYTALNGRMILNNELERMWKEAVISQNLPGE